MDDVSQALRATLSRLVREATGGDLVGLEPLSGGLGLRRFFRLRLSGAGPRTAIARVEAPEDPAGRPAGAAPEPPLEPLRSVLERAGLPVPARLGGDPAAGIELLEDVGDVSLEHAAAEAGAAERRALYAEACGLVARLQRVPDPGGLPAFARRLDASLFVYKAELFVTWSLPLALAREARPAEAEVVREAFARIAAESAAAPQRLSHRDYQSRNLHLRAGAPAGRRLVLLDLQGALLAPPEYDLACLLRDSYVELPEAEVDAQLAAVRPALPDAPPAAAFERRFDLLSLTRKGKDHARFVYAARTRGDDRWLRHLPVTVRQLRRAVDRLSPHEPWLGRLAELVRALPEDACAR
jgi:aminoglycoside/choline kinase family phosphotransferase